jgi:antitoxin (DNA-binding transcriptional repressor) of toxin-antitoxin stability system
MATLSIPDAKASLEELIARAARGEDVRIRDPRHGTVKLQVVAEGAAFVPLAQDRVPGRLQGKLQVPARLMEPMTEAELREWYGDDA